MTQDREIPSLLETIILKFNKFSSKVVVTRKIDAETTNPISIIKTPLPVGIDKP